MQRGKRISNKTKSAVKQALMTLIHTINYPKITVSDITSRADVGRSTFYRHYSSKADVLIDFHKDLFERIFPAGSFSDKWMGKGPPSQWISLLKENQRLGRNPFQLNYKLGSDLDYLINNITGQLTRTIQTRLEESYSDDKLSLPAPLLAQAISASFSSLVMTWFCEYQSQNIERYTVYIHRMIRALILEALVQ